MTLWLLILVVGAALGGVLPILAGLLVRRRIRNATREETSGLTDGMVRRIERTGRIHVPAKESLDLDAIRAEEDAFWAETWDEPEEW